MYCPMPLFVHLAQLLLALLVSIAADLVLNVVLALVLLFVPDVLSSATVLSANRNSLLGPCDRNVNSRI